MAVGRRELQERERPSQENPTRARPRGAVYASHLGGAHQDDAGCGLRFVTIRNNLLVSLSCSTFAPAPSVRNGEFSFLGDDGLAISGTLVSPVNAVGTIDVTGCREAQWWSDKRV